MTFTRSSRRRAVALAGIAATLILGACSGPAASEPPAAPAGSEPAGSAPAAKVTGDIELWHFFTDREAGVIQTAVDNFTKANPDIHVTVKSGQDDEKVLQAISAGQPVDVAISYSTDQVGPLCSSGAFIDLKPFIDRDKVNMDEIPAVTQSYTQYNGTRCTLPSLADAYAIYYNKDLFTKAGLTEPPKTLDELTQYAVKLTEYNADGSIKVAGFMPLTDYYETNPQTLSAAVQAKWLNDDGTSAIGSDPNWRTLFNWQKDIIGKLGGYDKLAKFQAGLGEEFSAQNDFHTGRTAIVIDGEFRSAFIADQAPDLNYGTAPIPVAADHADAYGAGYIGGNIIGIGKGSQNPDAAWELVKYLALNTDAQVQIGNGLKNVPTIASAAQSPNLEVSEQYKVFLEVYANAKSVTTPPAMIGAQYQEFLGQFAADWQSGKQTDLEAGLRAVDENINAAVELGG